MSHFGAALGRLIQSKEKKPADVARLTGISHSQLSRWLNNEQTWISVEDFTSIAKAVAEKENEQAELLVARLMDECQGPGARLVQINLKHGPGNLLKEPHTAYKVKLTEDIEHAFEVLREHATLDRDVRELVLRWGNILEKGTP